LGTIGSDIDGASSLKVKNLGDGTLTKYFLRISGDSRFDVPYFTYLQEMTKELFGLSSSIKILKENRKPRTFKLKSITHLL